MRRKNCIFRKHFLIKKFETKIYHVHLHFVLLQLALLQLVFLQSVHLHLQFVVRLRFVRLRFVRLRFVRLQFVRLQFELELNFYRFRFYKWFLNTHLIKNSKEHTKDASAIRIYSCSNVQATARTIQAAKTSSFQVHTTAITIRKTTNQTATD